MNKLPYLLLIPLLFSACEPDEIIVYHKRPIIELAKPPAGQPTQMEVIQKDIQNIPKLVRKPKYELAPEVMTIKKHYKTCEPACISPSTCNSTTGSCEAVAGKWTPEKEHSAIFLVDTTRSGTFESGDEYLMKYR